MKKIFFLAIALLAITACERTEVVDLTNSTIKNEATAKQTEDGLQQLSELEQDVDPGTIVPPRR